MKKNFYVLFAIFIANILSAQTDLVKWALTANGNTTYTDSRITATAVGTSQNPITYDSQGMRITGWGNNTIEHYRYFGFSVGSSNGTALKISNLAFEQERVTTNLNDGYTIRYYIAPNNSSVDDYDFFYNKSTVLVNNESITSNTIKNIALNFTVSGTQRLIVRFYASGNEYNAAAWRIKANTLKLTEVQATVPVANNDSYSVYKNTATDLNILANDTSGSAITGITITQQPLHGTLTVNGSTNVTYTPTTGYDGSDTFKYKAVNTTGASNEATVSVNVIAAVPVANNDTYNNVYNYTDTNLNILSNDTSVLAITGITITQQPVHGTVTVNGTTNVTYKSVAGYTGSDTFKYKSSNVTGESNEAIVSINVIQDPNTAVPVANNDSYTAYKNISSDFNVLSNDTSVLTINDVTITQQPIHGTVTVNGTTNVTYKPTTGYTGTDSFKYKASNATGLSNEATASINVIEMPPSTLVRWNNSSITPTTYNNNVTPGVIEYSKVSMGYNTWSGPLYSFGGWPSQTTVDTSYYVQFSINPKSGYKLNLSEFTFQCFLTGSGTMKIDYSLSSNFSNPKNLISEITPSTSEGNPTTISLSNFNTPVATDGQVVYVRIYIYNTNQTLHIKYANGADSIGPAFRGTVSSSSVAPVATNDTAVTTIDNDIDINVLENDDYSNIANSIALSQPSHGTVTLNSDKTVNYLPTSGYIGSDSFTYSIANNYGTSNTATVSVNVNPATTTSLIRWDSASATYYPTSYQQSFISANDAPITAVGVNLSTAAESLPVYVVGNIGDASINTSKYIQFRLNNISTTKTIEPKSFSFTGRGYNAGNYEIRYSKSSDFSSYQTLSAGTFSNGYGMISGNFSSVKVEAGETLYIRAYFYNTTSSYVIQYYTGSTGPAVTGLFYNKVYSSTDTIWQPLWSNGLPDATKSAIINAPYSTAVNGNFESNNLTINAGASLNVNAEGYITVNGKITNNAGASNFVVENDANLLQKSRVQNVGNITVQKNTLLPKMGYNYWSSPVIDQKLYEFSEGYNSAGGAIGNGTPWNRFYVYNEANDKFVTTLANDITLSETSVFQPSRGYAIRGKNKYNNDIVAETFQFTGIPQNGDVASYILKWTNDQHGYNMVGNPYPSNISFDDLVAANSSNIEGVAYFWTNNDSSIQVQMGSTYTPNNYALLNVSGGVSATFSGYNNKTPNGLISVGQGFIIQATQAGKNKPLVFNNTMRRSGDANYYNKSEVAKDRFWLEFKSPSDINNEILIGYLPGATDNFDSSFDSELLAIGNDSFWSIFDGKKLGIQGKQYPLSTEDNVKLGIKASVAGNYTIFINEKNGIFSSDQSVYLKDKYLSKTINITSQSYVFYSNAGQFEDRFEILYKTSGTLGTDNSVKKGIQIYKDIQNFIINSPDNLDEVSLYDALGRLVFESKNSKKEILISKNNLPEGMYIIKARSGKTTLTKKVLK